MMGRNYLAFDRKLNKRWAVKQLSVDRSDAAWEEEIMMLRSIDSIYFPRIVDVCREAGRTYIVMDHIDGESLKSLADRNAIDDELLSMIAQELCRALMYLHSINIICCDLQPANVIVTKDRQVRLTDPCSCIRAAGNMHHRHHRIVATRAFSPPEQLQGRIPDRQSDIYALGMTLGYCIRREHIAGIYPIIIHKCTKADPHDRYSDVSEILNLLKLQKILIRSKKYIPFKNRKMLIPAAVLLMAAILIIHKPEGKKDTGAGISISEESISGECVSTGSISGNNAEPAELAESQETAADRAMRLHDEARMLLQDDNTTVASLLGAAGLLEEEKEIIEELDFGQYADYKIENLSMLSTIYRLLGRKIPLEKEKYYKSSLMCIEDLLQMENVRESELYRIKYADLVAIKNELGDTDGALRSLDEWERENPDSGKELYFAHAYILMAGQGNEKQLGELYLKMEEIDEVTEDFRYENIRRQILTYIGSNEEHIAADK